MSSCGIAQYEDVLHAIPTVLELTLTKYFIWESKYIVKAYGRFNKGGTREINSFYICLI